MYFDITIWKGMGEWINKNIKKGDQIVVHGRLRWREWEKDGQKHQSVDITADSIVPVTRAGSGSSGSSSNPVRTNETDIPADSPAPVYGNPDEDDIPF